MKKWVGKAAKGRSEEGRVMGGRRRSRSKKCRTSAFANTGRRPARRHCSLGSGFSFVWFLICLKVDGLSWPLPIDARRQQLWMCPKTRLGLERKAGARNEPGGSESCLFQGWNLQQNFMASEKKILSVYKQEGMSLRSWRSWEYITIKCLRAWKFRRRESD